MADDGNVLQTVLPGSVRRIHLLGIGGTGMGSFAGMLKSAGYEVTGSDENVYPPMSEMLQRWKIAPLTPYRAENLDVARPDLVVVGNVIRRVNPEATAVRERRLPAMSFPAALGSLFLDGRHPVVITGTHGKTTTSGLVAHLLVAAGRDPSFLVGGVTRNYASNMRVGQGPHVVVEGDEYDTAYFDKGPKFLHYRPRTALLTSMELDHADIYRDADHYASAFGHFIALLPRDGFLAVSAAYPRAVELARAGPARVLTYAAAPSTGAELTAAEVFHGPDGVRFSVVERGEVRGVLTLRLSGLHNVENALGAWAVAEALGLSFEEAQRGFASYEGVKRRQEIRGEPGGVRVIDDFAHHPTAVRETVRAIAARSPGRRLWAVFEPRSNTSRRRLHQAAYAEAFDGAARVSLKTPERHDQVPEGEELDVGALVADLRARGIEADASGEVSELVERVAAGARAGDVLLVMSNGSFGGFIERLLARLSVLLLLLGCAASPPVGSSSAALSVASGPRPQASTERAPTLAFAEFPSGSVHALSADRGHVVILDAWATWCAPCTESLPRIQAFQARYASRGVRTYAVSVDEDPRLVEPFLKSAHVTLPVLLDPGGTLLEPTLKLRVMPTTWVFDRRGTLRQTVEGYEGNLDAIELVVNALLLEGG